MIKAQLYQNFVCYTKEQEFGYQQSYPLPTPSMVKGLVHSLLCANAFIPMTVSIQGSSDGATTNLQKVYKFDQPRTNLETVWVSGKRKGLVQGIRYVDEIMNARILLHIDVHAPGANERLFEALQEQTVCLGRHEDIARVDSVAVTTLRNVDCCSPIILNHAAYVPQTVENKHALIGIVFRLPCYYKDPSQTNGLRHFSKVKVVYLDPGFELDAVPACFDADGDPVFPIEIVANDN